MILLCDLQVELTGLNTVLVQNLSSLSTYLVSVQSHYPQGLSAAITGNITTCNPPFPRQRGCAVSVVSETHDSKALSALQ